MKKIYSFISYIAIIATINTYAMQPERHSVFTALDTLMPEYGTAANWQAIFSFLQKLVYEGNIFTVNDYFSQYGLTLLCQAAEDDDFLATKILLEQYNANPNKGTKSTGMTPLMIACHNGNIELVVLLLRHGANPSIKNKEGHDSFYFAQKYAQYDLLHDNTILRILKTYQLQEK